MIFDNALKYVIVETAGGELPIIFNNIIDHATVIPHDATAISAGYCEIWPVEGSTAVDGDYLDLEVNCFGQSTTLKLEARPVEDAEIIKRELDRTRR